MPESSSPTGEQSTPAHAKIGGATIGVEVDAHGVVVDREINQHLFAQIDEARLLRSRVEDLLREVQTQRDLSLPDTRSVQVTENLLTQLREANQHLVIASMGAQALQEHAEAVQARQQVFLSMLSHELRNPLAPILLATELLGRLTHAHPDLPELHAILRRQSTHLSHLVNDLLDASRIQSGKIVLSKAVLPLAEIMDLALETSQAWLEKRFQHLELDLPKFEILIEGDFVRLAQVFSNLLINASKFSPEYEAIKVTARRRGERVTIAVLDHGIGIAEEEQESIFELFTQKFHGIERSQGGLGIGLSVVRTIVEMHHGTVEMKSDGLGFGCEFLVSLPIYRAAQAASISNTAFISEPVSDEAASSNNDVPTVSHRVLIVEDNLDMNNALSKLLKQAGHQVASAFDGLSGLELAESGRFDVIVCDLGLPNMDGFALSRQLSASAYKKPLMIALTGYNQSEKQQYARESGFDHYLMKPIELSALQNLISQHDNKIQ